MYQERILCITISKVDFQFVILVVISFKARGHGHRERMLGNVKLETFRDFLLPDLIANRISRQRAAGLPFGKLRLWSSAASTGQEAYSLAMVISDFLQTQPTITSKANPLKFENFSILGTDISAQAIEYASKGIYSVRELERGLTVDQKRKYFLESHGNFTVHSQIKGMVEFKRMDLTKPFVDANSVDFILCRNLLIYFD